jgi:hypothetical protein
VCGVCGVLCVVCCVWCVVCSVVVPSIYHSVIFSCSYVAGVCLIGHSKIDLLEYYSADDPFSHHHTIHIWPNGTNDHNYPSHVMNSDITKVHVRKHINA